MSIAVQSRIRVRRAARPAQAGQVLPAAVGLLLAIVAIVYLMVNSGQSVAEKMRVTNAADAAAYSAGIVEARALNYDAYLNRAMIANQIVIAQMVSFASWAEYFASASDHIAATAADIGFMMAPNAAATQVTAIFAGTEYASRYFTSKSVKEYADALVDDGIGPIIAVQDIVVQALSASQKAVQLNLAAGIRQGEIADQIAKAMDPALQAQVVPVSYTFDAFTKNYAKSGSGDERGRMADVTVRSRDAFTRERDWEADSTNIPGLRKDGALKKRGGTELIGYDEWRGVDTLELHGRRFGCGWFGIHWCSDIRKPVAWAGIEVDAGRGDSGHGVHGHAYRDNPTTARNADGEMTSPKYTDYHGIADSQDIRDTDPAHDAVTGITVTVTKSHGDLLTSGGAAKAKPAGMLALFGARPAGGRLMALSRAEVYFDRIADRADGKQEFGSLYNPYWRVRLVAPTAADRAYAAARQGGLALP